HRTVEFHHDELPHADPPPPYPRRTIPDSTISALRELFLRMIRTEMMRADDAPRASDDLLDSIALLCADARRHDVRAEQLVIAIKRGWASLHQERQRPRAAGPDELLNHVITLCIDVYYDIDEQR
ncbi:MAG: hypothetical protein ACREMU_09665, partial [Gemmatimonadaceae bacterium]